MDTVESLRDELLGAVSAADGLDALDQVRITALGKKGRITEQMKGLGKLDPEARREAAQMLNALKDEVAAALDSRKSDLARGALDAKLASETLDVTLPARHEARGRIHPITQTID